MKRLFKSQTFLIKKKTHTLFLISLLAKKEKDFEVVTTLSHTPPKRKSETLPD